MNYNRSVLFSHTSRTTSRNQCTSGDVPFIFVPDCQVFPQKGIQTPGGAQRIVPRVVLSIILVPLSMGFIKLLLFLYRLLSLLMK